MKIKSITANETYNIRQAVLWPDKPIEHCMLDGDDNALHIGAFVESQLICVASVFISNRSARLRKFATLPEFQSQGIGGKVISHILQYLLEQSVNEFWCDAREDAVSFYERFGLEIEGERFYKEDVTYFKMVKRLPLNE